jgi:hypothetical protein
MVTINCGRWGRKFLPFFNIGKDFKLRINKYMAEIGRKGGIAGKGKSKIRGDSEYYKKISQLAAEKRKMNKENCPDKEES